MYVCMYVAAPIFKVSNLQNITPHSIPHKRSYSCLLITQTFQGNCKRFELSRIRVIKGKIIYKENDLKGKSIHFELVGGSSH